ncbi:hypothetical protein ACFY12_10815 [Streptomyces sp. NPDC001339]|uniref:hypothetical protein n=1 Tax=Streptomyces sp. NPDC001339 TaxID=3364563 RepID=UPI0036C49DE8
MLFLLLRIALGGDDVVLHEQELSGVTEIESMPALTRMRAKSGSSLTPFAGGVMLGRGRARHAGAAGR